MFGTLSLSAGRLMNTRPNFGLDTRFTAPEVRVCTDRRVPTIPGDIVAL
eukprot:SAG31_NODE_3644_length_4030_cov_2.539557_4_plen_49_part_00